MKNIFYADLELYANATAIISKGGEEVTYTELAALADGFSKNFPKNHNQLFLLAADNSLESIIAYLAALRSSVPVILTPHDKPDTFENILNQFKPTVTYRPCNGDYKLELHPENESTEAIFPAKLAVLLSTSGTTGSAKLVKLSEDNINANAKSIAEYLQLDKSERAIISLPMYYSYGLSVLNSHLSIGASLVLNDASVVDEIFWQRFNQHACTSFAGVPYSYELLKRSGFENREVPSLRYMTQAGGKLPNELVEYYALLANKKGWRFFVMYGQTEATARMSYLPPDKVLTHLGSMGIAIPKGRFELIDEKGLPITATNQPGELIYHGPNVMMGYATKREDLYDDSILSELRTGDIAWCDKDGFYYISGRKSRFLKIFGNRIGLDDLESALRGLGYVTVCGGTDKHLIILTIDQGNAAAIETTLAKKYGLTRLYASVEEVKDFPLLPSGKIDYAMLVRMSEAKITDNTARQLTKPQSIFNNFFGLKQQQTLSALEIFSQVFSGENITEESSFISLGGDSLNYVQTMILLEKKLGQLPKSWQELNIRQIENLSFTPQANFTPIETSVILRVVAIIGVLLNHTAAINPSLVEGGSALLMFLVGYSFARFQSPLIFEGKVWTTIWFYLKKIIISYMVISVIFMAAQILLFNQKPQYDYLLMFSNFYRPAIDGIFHLWFIQVLVQCMLVVGIIFTNKKFRNYAKVYKWESSIALLGAFSVLCFLINDIWSGSGLAFRLPHIYLPLIVLGWCTYFALTSLRKNTLYLYSVFMIFVMYILGIWHTSQVVWLCVGMGLLIFIPTIKIPSVTKAIISAMAEATFFIYLSHIYILHFIKPIVDNNQARFVLLVVSCLLAFNIFKKLIVLYHNNFTKKFRITL